MWHHLPSVAHPGPSSTRGNCSSLLTIVDTNCEPPTGRKGRESFVRFRFPFCHVLHQIQIPSFMKRSKCSGVRGDGDQDEFDPATVLFCLLHEVDCLSRSAVRRGPKSSRTGTVKMTCASTTRSVSARGHSLSDCPARDIAAEFQSSHTVFNSISSECVLEIAIDHSSVFSEFSHKNVPEHFFRSFNSGEPESLHDKRSEGALIDMDGILRGTNERLER